MDFIELAKARYSVRSFKQNEIEEDKLSAIEQKAVKIFEDNEIKDFE